MKTGGNNYLSNKSYYLRLWRFDETKEFSATVMQFNAHIKVILHEENKELDFSDLNRALLYLMVDHDYKFMSSSVQLKAV
jgi:hypothetical protein